MCMQGGADSDLIGFEVVCRRDTQSDNTIEGTLCKVPSEILPPMLSWYHGSSMTGKWLIGDLYRDVWRDVECARAAGYNGKAVGADSRKFIRPAGQCVG